MNEENNPFSQEASTPLLSEPGNDEYVRLEDDPRFHHLNASVAGAQSSRLSFDWRKHLKLLLTPFIDDTGSGVGVVYGLAFLTLVGSIIGFAVPKDEDLPTIWYRYVSSAMGYTYFICWSVSFYPQVITNFKRKSTEGLSVDFCALNVLGFGCYMIYNVAFFWSKDIEQEYKDRNGADAEITVQSNDVAFAIHAFILSSVTLLQIAMYGGSSALRVSKPVYYGIVCVLFVALFNIGLVMTEINLRHFSWLNFLYLLGNIKVGISLVKYIPQVIMNAQRKSTIGWSIWNVLLDFTGGLLSDLQLVFDCWDMSDFGGITGNIAKFALGSVSILFDLVFMAQHYCLYPESIQGQDLGDTQSFPVMDSLDGEPFM